MTAVESLRGTQVTELHEQGWDRELKLGGIEMFKQMLNMYLEQYTRGAVRNEVVETCGTV